MKIKFPKIIIFLIFCSITLNAYPFWIWSPKTQKWKNPKYSPLATPYLQFKEAEKYFNNRQFKEASKEFKKLLVHYADSKEAADAQYYLGRCLEELHNPYQAFLEYHKVIDSYPNSKRINEVVEREYNIGEYFLNREPKKWLGVSIYDLTEHPSLEIFKKIVEKAPYSTHASQAQYKLGLLYMQLGRYDEARDAFQKVLDSYSDSEWVSPAKYQLAIATSKASFGADYDSTAIQDATKRLDEFVKKHPDADISPQAIKQLHALRDREAKKNFDIAQFYEVQGRFSSALTYYKVVVDKYNDSSYVAAAEQKVNELSALTENKMSKTEYEKKIKQETRAAKKDAAARAKEDKARVKQEKRDESMRKKEERKQQKLDALKEKKAKTGGSAAPALAVQEKEASTPIDKNKADVQEKRSHAPEDESVGPQQKTTEPPATVESQKTESPQPANEPTGSAPQRQLQLKQPDISDQDSTKKIRFGDTLEDENNNDTSDSADDQK